MVFFGAFAVFLPFNYLIFNFVLKEYFMTTKSAILLIVKQNPGIDYNSLLGKFASSYTNLNSARAALSRSLKDLAAIGMIEKKDNKFYLLEKGQSEIYSAMKNKLLLSLNALLKERKPENQIDFIVEKLQIIIERGKQDKDLLKTSKSSLDFSISDLEKILVKVEEKTRHLDYISKVLKDQLSALKELGFYDSITKTFSETVLSKLADNLSTLQDSEFTFECQSQELINLISEKIGSKPRGQQISIPKQSLPQLAEVILSNRHFLESSTIKLLSSTMKAEINKETIKLTGSFNDLAQWRNQE